jgi:hypothetical protein
MPLLARTFVYPLACTAADVVAASPKRAAMMAEVLCHDGEGTESLGAFVCALWQLSQSGKSGAQTNT